MKVYLSEDQTEVLVDEGGYTFQLIDVRDVHYVWSAQEIKTGLVGEGKTITEAVANCLCYLPIGGTT